MQVTRKQFNQKLIEIYNFARIFMSSDNLWTDTKYPIAHCYANFPPMLHVNLNGHQHRMNIELKRDHAVHFQHGNIIRLL